MPISVSCPHCGNRYTIDTKFDGKRVKCPGCAGVFVAAAAPARTPRRPEKASKVPLLIAAATVAALGVLGVGGAAVAYVAGAFSPAKPVATVTPPTNPADPSPSDPPPADKPVAVAPPTKPAPPPVAVEPGPLSADAITRAKAVTFVVLPDPAHATAGFVIADGYLLASAAAFGYTANAPPRPRTAMILSGTGPGQRPVQAVVIAASPADDVVVLRAGGDGLPPPTRVGNARDLKPGQRLLAVGFPHQGATATPFATAVDAVTPAADGGTTVTFRKPLPTTYRGALLLNDDGDLIGLASSAVVGTQVRAMGPTAERLAAFAVEQIKSGGNVPAGPPGSRPQFFPPGFPPGGPPFPPGGPPMPPTRTPQPKPPAP